VEDPEIAAGGRQGIALQFGPRQHDLKIKSPPPVEPAPTAGIVPETAAPSLPAPVAMIDPIAPPPLNETVTTPTTEAQVPRVDGGLEPIRPAALTPAPTAGSSGTTSSGLTGSTSVSTPGRITSPDVTTPGMPPPAPVPTPEVGPHVVIESPAPAMNTALPSTSLGKEGVAPDRPIVVATGARPYIDPAKLAAAQKAFRDALAAFAANDRPRAAACYQDAIDNDPEMVEAYINLAGLQTLSQQYDKAELNYQKAVNIQPEHAKALFGLGSAQLLRKNPQMARETLGKLLRIRGNDAAAWVLYGDASLAIRENSSAVSAWKEAIRLAPGTALAKMAQDRLTRYAPPGN
jgi:predicted negative regulator of RcsB-dependent stress response